MEIWGVPESKGDKNFPNYVFLGIEEEEETN